MKNVGTFVPAFFICNNMHKRTIFENFAKLRRDCHSEQREESQLTE